MYSKTVAYKDFAEKPRNEKVHFNLMETEVIKLLPEFQTMFSFQDRMKERGSTEISGEETLEFYNALEEIMLASYGVPEGEGRYFRKSGRYDFAESALFNACMMEFVTDPREATAFVDGILPKGMEEIARKVDANYAEAAKASTDPAQQQEIARLRAQLAELTTEDKAPTGS